MNLTEAPALASQREFKITEAFFSCTDSRGVIVLGNEVFRRVSGYSEPELFGSPHSIVRHPDMPRAVFALIWRELEAGMPVAAYVKNMAKDGSFYWVLALFSPATNGYISIRIKPTSPMLAQFDTIYREMRSVELARERHGTAAKGMAESEAYLLARIREFGFPDYPSFMCMALLPSEMDSRDYLLGRNSTPLFPAVGPSLNRYTNVDLALLEAYRSGVVGALHIQQLYEEMRSLSSLGNRLTEKEAVLKRIGADTEAVIRNVALHFSGEDPSDERVNAALKQVQDVSQINDAMHVVFSKQVQSVVSRLSQAVFCMAWARLQYEMSVLYFHEVLVERLSGETNDLRSLDDQVAMIDWLRQTLSRTGKEAAEHLIIMGHELIFLSKYAQDYSQAINELLFSKAGSLVEGTHLKGDRALSVVDAVHSLTSFVDKHFKDVSRLAAEMREHAEDAPRIADSMHRLIDQIESSTHAVVMARKLTILT